MFFGALQVDAQQKKPNILVIWGDDVGYTNVSVYSHGMMGYKTPNIDSLAKDGALFTDFYGQQSCTAGRSAFILGEHPFRTGLLTVGLPGSPHGIPDWAPTIADLLKPQDMRPASSARITWVTRTSTCRPITGSMYFSATSTT